MSKVKLTKKQLNILYECWKDNETTKERLVAIEKNLPNVVPLSALSIMRRMAKTDTKWLKMATRKKNLKEKEKEDRKKAIEVKKIEKEKKKIERERKRKEKKEKQAKKNKLNKIGKKFDISYLSLLEEKIQDEYFFCSDVHQYVNNLSCIYRVFSDEFDITLGTECNKCSKMNKFIPIIEEILNGRQEKIGTNTTSQNRSEIKKSKTKKPSSKRKSTSNK